MSLIELGLLIANAAICGVLGQFLTGYSRGGCPVAFVAALVGGFLGPAVAGYFDWREPYTLTVSGVDHPVIGSAAGALALVLLVNLLTRKRKF